MYFITKRTSKTGKKFQKLSDKFNICFESQKALAVRNGEYMPKLNIKQGKAIQADFNKAVTVSKSELNSCIGWDEGFSESIGFNSSNDKYFGFIIDDDWTDIIIPADCTEITATKYRELFKK